MSETEKTKEELKEEKRLNSLNEYINKMKDSVEFADSYKIKIETFEGPIDLLLHLVKAAKIDIHEIFVSEITNQYLSYMSQISSVDLEKASDFIEVAAILIEIKSKSIIPKTDEESDDDDLKRELIQKIEEYRLFKEASEKMKRQEIIGQFFKEPDKSSGDYRIVLKDMNMDGLMKALQKLFLKLDKKAIIPPQRSIVMDRFTVSEKMAQVSDIFLFRDQVSFYDLFEDDYSRVEIITTFQAVLELLKMQKARVIQEDVFSEIIICKVDNSLETETEKE